MILESENPELNIYFTVDGFDEVEYLFKNYHRDNSRRNEKSIWSITFQEELDSFITSFADNYCSDGIGWGSYLDNGSLSSLGINPHNENLFFAKFVDSQNNSKWHGYPADYVRRIQDKPSTFFLKNLYEGGVITKSVFSKIKQGKRCNP